MSTSNFSDFVSCRASCDALVNGELALKTVAHLALSNLQMMPVATGEAELGRVKPEICEKSKGQLPNGEDYIARKRTGITSKGTVFGPAAIVEVAGSYNDTSGIVPAALTAEGGLDLAWLKKEIKLINPSGDLRENKVNDLLTVLSDKGIYDNATALLTKLILYGQQLKIFSKMETNKTTFYFGHKFAVMAKGKDDAGLANVMLNYVHNCQDGKAMGITIADMIEEGWVKAVKEWLENQPEAYIVDATGTKIVNYSCGFEQLGFPVTYFECHSYDDGNSQSGKSFMSECGFRNGRYKLPKSATHLIKKEHKLYKAKYFSAQGGDEAARLTRDRGHINCSGLTQVEYGVLNNILCNTQRRSPLLCDQEIDFNLANNSIAAYNGPEVIYDDEESEVTHMNVVRLIQKLVQNHRWYEALRDAMIMSSYWLMQPSTETLESHWWVCLKRRMLLPQIGLTRAVIPQLVSITATNVSREGLDAVKAVGRLDDSLLVESLYKNTCWYWGEYLAIYSAKDMDSLLDKMYKTADDNLNIQARFIALVSAVTGKHVPTTNTGTMFVMIDGGIKAQLKRTVCFGKIQIPHIEEYGYSINAERVVANSLVAPGCVGLILGMGGDLIKYTPYGNAFGINQAVRMRKTSGYQEGYSWYDLWALCVVADWQGYDVLYTTPGDSKKLFKSYSPGECSVAAPPVRFSSEWDYGKYVVKGVIERDTCYGSNAADVHRAKRSFVWTRTSCKIQRITEYGTIDAPSEELDVVPIDDYIVIEKQRENYMAYVLATYNMDESDFYVEYTRTAIPVHTGIPVLESTHTEEEQPPTESDGNI